MCVIFIADTVRPTEEMIEQANLANPAGMGAAWRHEGSVVWEKGLSMERMQEIAATVPFPFILHFRIPTEGGTRAELCHPFLIQRDASVALRGKTKGEVLFHNGHWNRWREWILDASANNGWKIPKGPWSDTRGMAWAAGHVGSGVLEFIDEKAVAFGPTTCEVYAQNKWSKVNDVWVSNKIFEHRVVTKATNTPYYRAGYEYHMGREGNALNRPISGTTTDGGTTKASAAPTVGTSQSGTTAYHTSTPASLAGGKSAADSAQVFEAQIVGTTKVPAQGGKKVVDLKVVPFAQVLAMFRNGEISKNQMKKARRLFMQDLHETRKKDASMRALELKAEAQVALGQRQPVALLPATQVH